MRRTFIFAMAGRCFFWHPVSVHQNNALLCLHSTPNKSGTSSWLGTPEAVKPPWQKRCCTKRRRLVGVALILGMGAEGHYQIIRARVPLKELHRYSSSLRSLTQGRAKFSMKFAEYSPVPGDIQSKLTATYAAHHAQED
jgi:hypothetical protein